MYIWYSETAMVFPQISSLVVKPGYGRSEGFESSPRSNFISMKNFFKRIILVNIVALGWISYWHGRPDSADMILIAVIGVVVASVLIGIMWAIKEIVK